MESKYAYLSNISAYLTSWSPGSYIMVKTCLYYVLELLNVTLFFILFSEFIQGVSQFSVKGDKLSKLRFAFRIYDMDNDGYISNGELFQVSC